MNSRDERNERVSVANNNDFIEKMTRCCYINTCIWALLFLSLLPNSTLCYLTCKSRYITLIYLTCKSKYITLICTFGNCNQSSSSFLHLVVLDTVQNKKSNEVYNWNLSLSLVKTYVGQSMK